MTNQEAIKIIEDECEHIKSHLKCKGKAEDFYKELGDMCIAFYMGINALEQEPKTGHWKPYLKEGLTDMCSECGSRFYRPWNYCPHCGARMESEDKE